MCGAIERLPFFIENIPDLGVKVKIQNSKVKKLLFDF
jgi:hypothetical protein